MFLKEIISEIKKIEKKFQFKEEDLNKNIHNTGIKLIEEKKLKNEEILLFIEKDIYYNNNSYANDDSLRSLKVLDGINIQALDMKDSKNLILKKCSKIKLVNSPKK